MTTSSSSNNNFLLPSPSSTNWESFDVIQEMSVDWLYSKLVYLLSMFRKVHIFDYPELDDILVGFLHDMKEVVRLCPKFDYKNVKSNGYRSILRSSTYIFQLALYELKPDRQSDQQTIRQFIRVIKDLTTILDDYLAFSDRQSLDKVQVTNDCPGRDFLQSCLTIYSHLTEFFLTNKFCGINFDRKVSKLVRMHVKIASLTLSTSAGQAFMNSMKMSSAHVTYVKQLAQHDPLIVANYVRKMNWSLIKASAGTMNATKSPVKTFKVSVKSRSIICPTRFRFQVTPDAVKLVEVADEDKLVSHIKIRVLRVKGQPSKSKRRSPTDILIFLHGGGFLGPRAAAVEPVFLKSWTRKLGPEVVVINVDFSLAPESPFPAALQEVLDFYLWLRDPLSNARKVLKVIPGQVVLSGDSSGGNLAASLTIALNDIRKGQNLDTNLNVSVPIDDPDGPFHVQMPNGLVLFFPKLVADFHVFPSLMLSIMDPLVNPFFLKSVLQAYVPFTRTTDDGKKVLLTNNTSQLPVDWISRLEYQPIMSYYLSPLRYPNLEQLFDVPLFVTGYNFDPFLDEAIEIARRWAGYVYLETLDGLGHAGFYFKVLSNRASQASTSAVNMVKKAFNMTID